MLLSFTLVTLVVLLQVTETVLRTLLTDSHPFFAKTLPVSRKRRAPTESGTVEIRYVKRQKLEEMDITKEVLTTESKENDDGPADASAEPSDVVSAPLGVGIASQ